MHDAAHGAVLLPADFVEDQALASVEADPQPPVRPAQEPAVEGERRALGLDYVQRALVAIWAAAPIAVVAGIARDRERAVVVDPHDGHRVEVDDRHEVSERARVAVVASQVRAEPGEAPRRTHRRVLEVAYRPGIHHHELRVIDATRRQRGEVARVALDRLLGFRVLLRSDRRLDVGHFPQGRHTTGAELDGRLPGGVRHWVEQHDEGLAGRARGVAVPPSPQFLLARLVQVDEDEAVALRTVAALPADGRRGALDLSSAERVERMLHVRRFRLCSGLSSRTRKRASASVAGRYARSLTAAASRARTGAAAATPRRPAGRRGPRSGAR
jgi:hypothetical protein